MVFGLLQRSGGVSEEWACDRRRRQRSEQYFTSSQQASHFFRQVNGRWQTGHSLVGKSDLERERAIISSHQLDPADQFQGFR